MVISARAEPRAVAPTVFGKVGEEVSGAMRYTID
jgi:hypothetical protein